MKTFEPGFFALENFIVKQETFDAREPQAGEPWHVAYNVNDPFFRIMGASMVSVLENNPDHPLCSIFYRWLQPGQCGKDPAAGGEMALPVHPV